MPDYEPRHGLEGRRWFTQAEWEDMCELVLPTGTVERALHNALRDEDNDARD
jgi:hypothetical protein